MVAEVLGERPKELDLGGWACERQMSIDDVLEPVTDDGDENAERRR